MLNNYNSWVYLGLVSLQFNVWLGLNQPMSREWAQKPWVLVAILYISRLWYERIISKDIFILKMMLSIIFFPKENTKWTAGINGNKDSRSWYEACMRDVDNIFSHNSLAHLLTGLFLLKMKENWDRSCDIDARTLKYGMKHF